MAMQILIRRGRLLDPISQTDKVTDILIEDGYVRQIGDNLDFPAPEKKQIAKKVNGQSADDEVISDESCTINAEGCWVMPGLVDLHVHLRDPGLTYKEDIETGSAAAAAGGYTTICAMPNTKPVIDTADKVNYVRFKAASVSLIHVMQIGAVTKGQKGRELADIAAMVDAGSPAISEDGKTVKDARLAKKAMETAAKLGIPVFTHCEDTDLVDGGVMNDDENSRRLDLPGICNSSEDVIAARNILLAKETGAKLHLCHVSTKESVEMVRIAKKMGIKVSAEVCPHHFTLTSDDIRRDDPMFKMNPPVRRSEDRDALLEGLRDGTIDCIATDHAPHAVNEKFGSMLTSAFGIVGLETAVPLAVTELVGKGVLTPLGLAACMSANPAAVADLTQQYGDGRIAEDNPADIVIIDPAQEWVIDKRKFRSKGRNTPFDGWKVRGRVKMTICEGEIVYRDEHF